MYFDFESTESNGIPLTSAGQFKHAILSTDGSIVSIVASGGGGKGKTCALQAIGNHPDTKNRFPGGILYMTMGTESTRTALIEQLYKIVKFPSGKCCARNILEEENDLGNAISTAGQWFQDHFCLFLIDDVWRVKEVTASVVKSLLSIAVHNVSRVAYTTRDAKLIGDEETSFGDRQVSEASKILLSSAGMPQRPEGKLTVMHLTPF